VISAGQPFLGTMPRQLSRATFFVAVTARFRLFYVLVLIEHSSRRLLHFNVTEHPSAGWTLQQLRETLSTGAFRYLIHDRDSIFARSLDESISNLGLTVLKSPPHSPRPRDLRTGDRNDSTRVFRLVDTDIGIAPAIHPKVMGRSLQQRAPTYVAGSWGSRSAGNPDVGPSSRIPTS